MRRILIIFLMVATMSFGAEPPRGFNEVGGSNYVMYEVGREYLDSGTGWFKPGVLQPVVATFHLQKKEDVRQQLKAMHGSGQRKIAIMMWHSHLPRKRMADGGIYGHVLASNGGALTPQHAENLKGLLALIREDGLFNELVFRFAQQGSVWSQQWKVWNEEAYKENLKFILSVRQQICDVLEGSDIKLVFDLGAELGGISKGSVPEYTRRLWADYTKRFGANDTLGFSIAAHPGRISNLIEVYDEVGIRPSRHALDLYKNVPKWMPGMVSEFHAAGIEEPRIIILETFWNSALSLQEFQQVADQFGLTFEYLMQWPWQRDAAHSHYSDVFGQPAYNEYLKKD